MDTPTKYHFYKPDFLSAYNSNGNNTEIALSQVSNLRDVDKEKLRFILKPLLKKLTK